MSAIATELTGAQLLPWAKTLLDYTDAVVGSLPQDESALDWRPTDESGGWYFSIREQAMHIADSRWSILGLVTGADASDRSFCKEYGGTGKPWVFEPAERERILESLHEGRAAIDAVLAKSQPELLESTEVLRASHEKALAQLREAGKDAELAEREARGPSRVMNMLLFIVAHEQSHRGVLQTMLRQRGHEVVRYA